MAGVIYTITDFEPTTGTTWGNAFSWASATGNTTSVTVTNADGTTTAFAGTGFVLDGMGVPTAGTVTKLERFNGTTLLESISFSAIFRPLVDFHDNAATILKDGSLFGGDDTITGPGSPPPGGGLFILNGFGGNDTITSGAGGPASIFGGIGNDLITSKNAGDSLDGGEGNDTYVTISSNDSTPIQDSGGTDTIIATGGVLLLNNHLTIENGTITGNTSQLGGNGLANVLTGNLVGNVINGFGANDTLIGGGGNDFLDGGSGADRMIGGPGNDSFFVDSPGDMVIEKPGQGADFVGFGISRTTPLFANVSDAQLFGVFNGTLRGNTLNNVLRGNDGHNTIFGDAGNDSIEGFGGNDRLFGGGGRDHLNGGTGGDMFIWVVPNDFGPPSAPDVVEDFSKGDHFNLFGIDANTTAPGNNAFNFIGTQQFHHKAGELRMFFVNLSGTAHDITKVVGDFNGDGHTDFAIDILGIHNLHSADFIR